MSCLTRAQRPFFQLAAPAALTVCRFVSGRRMKYRDRRFTAQVFIMPRTPSRCWDSPSILPLSTRPRASNSTAGSNNTFDTAQDLGNLLGVDRGTLNVGGYIQNATDVNWYKFSVGPGLGGIQRIANVSGTGSMWPTIFDVDYADGMSRPDLTLWVFDDQGRLILTSTDSKIADDLTGAATGTDASDLSAGSFGLLDPFIGPAFLPESGRTYYVAVSCPGAVADAFNQALLRREPMESVDRVVEDHLNPVDQLGGQPTTEITSLDLTPDRVQPWRRGHVCDDGQRLVYGRSAHGRGEKRTSLTISRPPTRYPTCWPDGNTMILPCATTANCTRFREWVRATASMFSSIPATRVRS